MVKMLTNFFYNSDNKINKFLHQKLVVDQKINSKTNFFLKKKNFIFKIREIWIK